MKPLFKPVYCGALLLCCAGLNACNEAPNQAATAHQAPAAHSLGNRQQQIVSEAKVDAEHAIEAQDFRLLALRNKSTSIPGVDIELNELATLEQKCGLLFMKNSGDEILQRSELSLRQEQYAYALIYNTLVLPACLSQAAEHQTK
ncbi:hypothetical protein [Paraglaciecola sp. 25GB23A]|uniref:hypothetical protein n=1 Tax=Paraglaciecola sp. 25GB23A TaxID=3156068 RepID=UPI0032AECA12